MPRPKAATPAAQIRSVLRFFETANLELAGVAFELVRAALADRKAKKKLTTPAKPAEKVEPLEQKVMVGTNYPAANAPGGRLDTPPPPAVTFNPFGGAPTEKLTTIVYPKPIYADKKPDQALTEMAAKQDNDSPAGPEEYYPPDGDRDDHDAKS